MRLFRAHAKERRLLLGGVFVVALLIAGAFSAYVINTPKVYAGGAYGSGGGGSGGSDGAYGGGPATYYGYGWRIFGVNDSVHPIKTRSGTSWSSIVSKCKGVGAQKVIAYIILHGDGKVAHSWVYNYPSSYPDGWSGYHSGSPGGNWLSSSQAHAKFLELSAADRAGSAWGNENSSGAVGYFCYDYGSFNLNVYSYISTNNSSWGSNGRTIDVDPGTKIYFRHLTRNVGNITAKYKNGIGHRYGATSGNFSYGSWSGYKTLGAGKETYAYYNTTIPADARSGLLYCQKHRVDRNTSNNGTDQYSNDACGKVKYWSISTPATTVTVDGKSATTAKPGQKIVFKHSVKNNTATKIPARVRYGYDAQRQGVNDYSHKIVENAAFSANQTKTFSGGTYTVSQADVGSKICERTYATPINNNDKATKSSDYAHSAFTCVSIPYNWSITPTAKITSAASVNQPGQTLTWSHSIKNNGPTKTNKSLTMKASGLGATNSWSQGSGFGSGSTLTKTSTYTIQQSDVGKTICRKTTVVPHSSSDSGTVSSANACRAIPYNYNLTPIVTDLPSAAQPGVPINYTGAVNKSGPTKSRGTEWRLVKFTLPAGVHAFTTLTTGSASPEAHYTYAGTSAQKIAGGTNKVFTAATTNVQSGSSPTPALEPGEQVCFALSVTPYDETNHSPAQWRYGIARCVEIAKSVYVNISGGDLRVGLTTPSPSASIQVNRVTISGKTYGSWAEYGAFAPGTSDIATGGNLATTTTRTTPSPSGNVGQKLTFANNKATATCATIDGCFGSMGARRDLYTKYTTKPSSYQTTTSLNLSNFVAGKYYYSSSAGVLTINGGTLKKGVSLVIDATGQVIISGDIKYAQGPYSKISDLPQLIIATKGSMVIKNNVTHIDAWLYAGGTVSTCDTIPTAADYTVGLSTTSDCNANHLVTNGPLSTGHLQLRRTYGGDPDQGGLEKASEEFNLRPDAYLWAYAQSQNSNLLTTVFTRELPPRF